jgi:hypothetical protein
MLFCYILTKKKTKWDAIQNEFVGGWFHSLSNLKKCGTILKSFKKKPNIFIFSKKYNIAFLNLCRAGPF